MKKILIIGLGVFVLLFLPFSTFGAYNGGGDLTIGIRADITKDESNWYNYTGDVTSGGQTLTVSPGDTVTFRGKAWNQSTETTFSDPVFHASITNSQYLEMTGGFYNDNLDGNGNYYSGSIGTDITLSNGALATNGNENNSESGTFRVKIKNDTPDQTLIEGTWELYSGGERIIGYPTNLSPIARAQGLAISQVRILVNNPQTQATELPRTGSNSLLLFIIPAILAALGTCMAITKKVLS